MRLVIFCCYAPNDSGRRSTQTSVKIPQCESIPLQVKVMHFKSSVKVQKYCQLNLQEVSIAKVLSLKCSGVELA